MHEAGYDSYLTARVLIKLSAQLEQAGSYAAFARGEDSDDEAYHTPPEDNGILLGDAAEKSDAPARGPQTGKAKKNKKKRRKPRVVSESIDDADGGGVLLTEVPQMPNFSTDGRRDSKSRFGHAGAFDLLSDDYGFLSPRKSESPTHDLRAQRTALSTGNSYSMSYEKTLETKETQERLDTKLEGFDADLASLSMVGTETKPGAVMMPPFDSAFWRVYGNKLRVFGTVEQICRMSSE